MSQSPTVNSFDGFWTFFVLFCFSSCWTNFVWNKAWQWNTYHTILCRTSFNGVTVDRKKKQKNTKNSATVIWKWKPRTLEWPQIRFCFWDLFISTASFGYRSPQRVSGMKLFSTFTISSLSFPTNHDQIILIFLLQQSQIISLFNL